MPLPGSLHHDDGDYDADGDAVDDDAEGADDASARQVSTVKI